MNGKEIIELFAYLGEAWQNYRLPESKAQASLRIEAYSAQLSDLAPAVARRAVDWFQSNEAPHPPTAGQIRRKAIDLADPAGRVPDVDEAWAEIVAAARRDGHAVWPDWSHPAVTEIVKALGWWEICHAENQETLRAHFRDLYRPLHERHARRRYVPTAVLELEAATLAQLAAAAR